MPSSPYLAAFSSGTLILQAAQSLMSYDRAALLLAEEKTTLFAKSIIPTTEQASVPVSIIKFISFDIFKTALPKYLSNLFLSVGTCTK